MPADRSQDTQDAGHPSRGSDPDPQVVPRAKRRRFSAAYKARIVKQAAACQAAGEVGALLRREGLDSSNLAAWRKQLRCHGEEGLARKRRGPAPKPQRSRREVELERENRKLQRKLAHAEAVIDFQKRLSCSSVGSWQGRVEFDAAAAEEEHGDLGGRGRRHTHEERDMILGLVQEGVEAGARQSRVCAELGLDARTVQRWKRQDLGEDRRAGPRRPPANKLSAAERAEVLQIANAPEHRDLSPHQIVPRLADRGVYVASESTFYRVLREAHQQQHREPSRAPSARHRPDELIATGPNQVWSWDISYLPTLVRGRFLYLYLVMDVWSRKIVGWSVHDSESSENAAALIAAACEREGVARDQLVIHSDNGTPMKGATLLATLQALGVMTSFSRPRVSDDNPYSEALFRTTKYRPDYPRDGFASLDDARTWVARFVRWYNTEHRHSAIRFVTPEQRHAGDDLALLANRRSVYEQARARHPERWTGDTRDWSTIDLVALNPADASSTKEAA